MLKQLDQHHRDQFIRATSGWNASDVRGLCDRSGALSVIVRHGRHRSGRLVLELRSQFLDQGFGAAKYEPSSLVLEGIDLVVLLCQPERRNDDGLVETFQ